MQRSRHRLLRAIRSAAARASRRGRRRSTRSTTRRPQTKRRLEIPEGALPTNFDDIELSTRHLQRATTASRTRRRSMIAFATGIDRANLVVVARTSAASITTRQPDRAHRHVDRRARPALRRARRARARQGRRARRSTSARRSCSSRRTRYAVAIKKTLKAKDGSDARDPRRLPGDPRRRRDQPRRCSRESAPRYPEIFAALEAQGHPQGRPRRRVGLHDALAHAGASRPARARAAALAMIGHERRRPRLHGRRCDTVPDRHADRAPHRRHVRRAAVPRRTTGHRRRTTKLVRDGAGKPLATGLYRAPFTAIIPQCAMNSTTPVPIIALRPRPARRVDQVASGGARAAAAELCAVAIGTDMRGMSDSRRAERRARAQRRQQRSPRSSTCSMQGMMNHIALVQIARGPMATDAVHEAGRRLARRSRAASTTTASRRAASSADGLRHRSGDQAAASLQVGAINYSMMLERSTDWPTYRTTLIGAYEDPLDRRADDQPHAAAVGSHRAGRRRRHDHHHRLPRDAAEAGLHADRHRRRSSAERRRASTSAHDGHPGHHADALYAVRRRTEAASRASGARDLTTSASATRFRSPTSRRRATTSTATFATRSATTDMMRQFYETGEITNLCTAPKGCDCTVAGLRGGDLTPGDSTAMSDTGLLHAFLLDGKGGGRHLDWAGVEAWTPNDGVLWGRSRLRSSRCHNLAYDPLANRSRHGRGADRCRSAPARGRPRRTPMLIVRGINLTKAPHPKTWSRRAWIEPDRIVTMRHRHSHVVHTLADQIERNTGPRSPGEFTPLLVERIVEAVVRRVDTLGDRIAECEHDVLGQPSADLRSALADLRRRAIALRRFLAPQREALAKLATINLPWLDATQRTRVAETADDMMRTIEELDAARDRAQSHRKSSAHVLPKRRISVYTCSRSSPRFFCRLVLCARCSASTSAACRYRRMIGRSGRCADCSRPASRSSSGCFASAVGSKRLAQHPRRSLRRPPT